MDDLKLHGLIGGGGNKGLWLYDWKAYDTIYDFSGVAAIVLASSYKTFVDVVGEGALLFASALCLKNPDIRITLDGVPYVFEGISTTVYDGRNVIQQTLEFKKTLKIEVRNRGTSNTNGYCDYMYLLKNSNPDMQSQTILKSSVRKMANHANPNNDYQYGEVVNVVGAGYILGVLNTNSGDYAAQSYLSLTVDGQVKINDRQFAANRFTYPQPPFFGGVIRFNNGFRVTHRTSTTGYTSESYTRVYYTLD